MNKGKVSNKLYFPIKIVNNRLVYCLDNKGKPKEYKSIKSLKKYMKGYFDFILVYTIEKGILNLD